MFELTRTEYNQICEELMLSSEYCKLLEMKIKNETRPKMASELGVSEATLDKMIKKLKKKLQKLY